MPDPLQQPFRLRLDTRTGALKLKLDITLATPWSVLFGPSGSGKTTVLRAICGLLKHADQSCFCEGTQLDGKAVSLDDKAVSTPTHERRIAYAPQSADLFPHLTVRENIAFAQSVRGRNARNLVDEALTLFELQPLAERMSRDLSGGERQRVNLARAFAVPTPRLMLLDEPFSGIGRALRNRLLETMRLAMAARGVQVVSVTHDVEEAFLLGAEVVRMERGQVLAQGPVEVVLADEREATLRALGG